MFFTFFSSGIYKMESAWHGVRTIVKSKFLSEKRKENRTSFSIKHAQLDWLLNSTYLATYQTNL